VINSSVYMGYTNSKVLDVNEFSGQIKWSYQTAGAVATTPSVSDKGTLGRNWSVFVGDATGRVYVLLASHGTFQFSSAFSGSGPVSGVATVRDAFFVETRDGTIRASRTYTRNIIWRVSPTARIE
jgi:outer membrane protein assembly factor BamB